MNKIVILQRGWVVVGQVSQTENEVTIEKASVIRRWGTTKGIGELVNGPLPNTVLDPAGTVKAHPLSVVMAIDADTDGWKKALQS